MKIEPARDAAHNRPKPTLTPVQDFKPEAEEERMGEFEASDPGEGIHICAQIFRPRLRHILVDSLTDGQAVTSNRCLLKGK